ncbi:DUF4097 and DUF4098 domain-containing protein YvlB [Microbacterium endophyticum]|uniref:DUF4097 and DUF4098 domain-containing protein YvlB n=1 Tax=Microbacterium endophyticum TaxID=1526412 RepID=A0A7W4V5A2_9MICO|nr:DUF4097 family beta strand repeat-containing protein [Microbacterium endophyticum]MBB2977085.1 DUF4097 and DUF4098 domain-containing protein YvlB [Microbacterium endophyticum]NIK36121.1 DUF4097 and DUF4098 domain-containing protein YvlB [Microbacterium endophyticum]
MTLEKWIVQPGQSRVIDIDDVKKLKIGMVGGQIDVVAHDEPGVRIEVHSVTSKDLRIEASGSTVEIDHPQLRWDNFLEVFRNFGSGGPKAEISVAVPRDVALTLGVVSASALISGLHTNAKLNTVSGDVFIDGLEGDVSVNAVSGDVQARHFSGALSANSVSGDVAVIGTVRKASIDTVSGAMLIDSTGDVHQINLNTVSGDATVRLDDALPGNYVVRSVSGRVQIDGSVHSGKGSVPGTNYVGSSGELSNSFVDVRANSVSGDIIVLRREESGVPSAESAEPETEELS